jgi:hypothetical protein
MKVKSPFVWPLDSRYERPLPLTWNSEYIYTATVLEILHILSVEQDYNIELTTSDFDNFNFFHGRTFATAAQLQELKLCCRLTKLLNIR